MLLKDREFYQINIVMSFLINTADSVHIVELKFCAESKNFVDHNYKLYVLRHNVLYNIMCTL